MLNMFKNRNRLKAMCGAAAATVAVGALVAAAPRDRMNSSERSERVELKIGEAVPAFTLAGTDKKDYTLADHKGKVVVLEWFNPDCPYVKKQYQEEHQTTIKLEKEYAEQDVVWMRINSGAAGKQGAGMERNLDAIADWGIKSAILLDESGEVGKAYGAKVTPEIFIIDTEGKLRYHGAIDNKPRPGGGLGDVNYVREALDSILAGETVETTQTKAEGCGIKFAK